jgi:hypothetical protein
VLWVEPVLDFVAVEDLADDLVCEVSLAVEDFLPWVPESESWRALAAGTIRQVSTSAAAAPIPALRISVPLVRILASHVILEKETPSWHLAV